MMKMHRPGLETERISHGREIARVHCNDCGGVATDSTGTDYALWTLNIDDARALMWQHAEATRFVVAPAVDKYTGRPLQGVRIEGYCGHLAPDGTQHLLYATAEQAQAWIDKHIALYHSPVTS